MVLPAPGGASMTRLGQTRNDSMIAGSRSSIGRLKIQSCGRLKIYSLATASWAPAEASFPDPSLDPQRRRI